MTMRRSAVRAISAIRWLETKTVLPSAASDFIRFLIQRIPSGSRPLTGSSKMSTRGAPRRAGAAPRRRVPPRAPPPRARAVAGLEGEAPGRAAGRRGGGGEPLGHAQGELARLAVGRP